MSIIKVSTENRSNGNSPVQGNQGNVASIFDREFGFGWTRLFDTLDRPFFRRSLLDDFFDDNLMAGRGTIGTTIPAVNIEETDTDLVINVAAPGMSKKDFVVEINDNQLYIGYKKESQSESKENNQWRREFNFESFDRSFVLPAIVEKEKIEATYNDGILKIAIPKKEEARRKPAKMIEIK